MFKYKGNRLTKRERNYRLKKLEKEIQEGLVDQEIIPYLERINKFPFLITTQSCCGHKDKRKTGSKAHIDFRSALSERDTINKILRPLDAKRDPPDIAVQIMIETYGVRYCLWLRNDKWEEQIEDFLKVLEEIKYEKS